MVDLTGKVAVVTGAGRGIGASTARELARQGARVVVNDNGSSVEGYPEDPRVAERTVAEIQAAGGQAVASVADVGTVTGAAEPISLALQHWGRLDAAICNAGSLRIRPIWDMAEADWDSVLHSHLTQTYAVTREACRWWRSRHEQGQPVAGRIVNLIAATGLTGRPDMGANHAAAKGAVAAFTMVVAQEMYPYGVTVNAVSPAAVRTRMATHVQATLPPPEPEADLHGADNVAPLIAYLTSDQAGWITGQVLRIVGGRIGWYHPWSVASSITSEEPWRAERLDQQMRTLLGLYPGITVRP
jgi:NAD(P)-dependent dehydrogenase (short-subunit alcohol dehydrogenase family)